MIDVPLIGEEDRTRPNHVPRSMLVGIIRPRIEETFELVRNRLEASGFDKIAGRPRRADRRRLPARRRAARSRRPILDKQVRIGRPSATRRAGRIRPAARPSRPPPACSPSRCSSTPPARRNRRATEAPSGRIGRIGSWIRENF